MARNCLIIMTDEHAPNVLGCAGHPIVKTPNLDRLAGEGTYFTNAYTPSPICVPARAGFQTGKYVFQTRNWSNAQPYHGQIESWGHRLKDAGHEVVSIGKLHFRSSEDDNGFSREIVPLHCAGGRGWIQGLLRRQRKHYDTSGYARDIGPGEDSYSDYDRRVTREALAWLEAEAVAPRDKPWVLFVSYLRPHYPLTCPKEFYELYPPDRIPPPRFAGNDAEYGHPVMAAARLYNDHDDHFPDAHARAVARASYFGLCSFVDAEIGKVLGKLEGLGRDKDTDVIYCSDHGDLNGEHGLWTKMTMHEESVGIPMMLRGAGVPRGRVSAPVSLIDVGASALECVGLGGGTGEHAISLHESATAPNPDRAVFSEYHDGGSITAYFMLRHGRWKYICYPGFAPQLFDIAVDPGETRDLGLSNAHEGIRWDLHRRLCAICDPEAVNAQAFADQADLIEALGGPQAILDDAGYDHTPVELED